MGTVPNDLPAKTGTEAYASSLPTGAAELRENRTFI